MQGSQYTVSDVMTSTVVALAGGATFKEIVRTMQRWGVSAMPVLDGDGHVTGVVSEADLLRKEEFRAGDADRSGRSGGPPGAVRARAVTARDLATVPAVTVHADATLAGAAGLMARHGVKRLPVVDDRGVLIGIVSRSDLLKVFLRSDEAIAQEVRHQVVAGRFPVPLDAVRVRVREGVVTLAGEVADTSVVPLALRLVRSVEGVVDVRSEITTSRHPGPAAGDGGPSRRTGPGTRGVGPGTRAPAPGKAAS
ncbi:CBS domain-containing protein [Streptomyces sp. NPDC056160]|uniref:CBS domain-containing protein n=1 Tax=Streptomyces sp. NPDC056160 TaxID=3345731 RepID=UPI0035D7F7F3